MVGVVWYKFATHISPVPDCQLVATMIDACSSGLESTAKSLNALTRDG